MHWPIAGIYRYDALLAYALVIQVLLVYYKLETPREVWVIAIFHAMAMLMGVLFFSIKSNTSP